MENKKVNKLIEGTILPKSLPEYSITLSAEPPFETVWEELQGWMIVPRIGESIEWGLYAMPSRGRTEYAKLEVTGAAQVHGIEGVEIDTLPSTINLSLHGSSSDQLLILN